MYNGICRHCRIYVTMNYIISLTIVTSMAALQGHSVAKSHCSVDAPVMPAVIDPASPNRESIWWRKTANYGTQRSSAPPSPAAAHSGLSNIMGSAYIFTLQPTFTQGLILGQFSILCLLVVVLKYLFFDTATAQPYKATSYQPRLVREDEDSNSLSDFGEKIDTEGTRDKADGVESAGWLNILLHHVRAAHDSMFAWPHRRLGA